ncbi:409_t:CDS:2, partial [Acaulospora colombiana]
GKDDGDRLFDGVDQLGWQVGRVLVERLDELVVEYRSGDGDTHHTTEQLEEREEGRSLWDECGFVRVFRLDSHNRELERDTKTGTENDLVPDQPCRTGILVNGEEQTGTDGTDDRTDDEHAPIVAGKVDECARGEGGDDGGQHEGDNVDSGLGGGTAFGLVEKGEVVGSREEGDHHEEHGSPSSDLSASFEQEEGEHGTVTLEKFPSDENDEQHAKHAKERNDDFIVPRTGDATPLEGQEQAGDHTDRDDGPDPVHGEPLLEGRHVFVQFGFGGRVGGDEKDDGGDGNGTEWKVDVKAPTPAKEERALFEFGDLGEDGEDGDEYSRSTDALERATENEHVHRGCDAANERSDFKEDDADEIDPFRGGDGEDLTECEHQPGLG